MKKKRYCIFAAQYFPHMGGVERYTYNLAKELLKRGNEVVIVTSNVYKLESVETIDGITIYRFPCFNLLDGRYPILKLGKELRSLDSKLKSERFDLVIVNTRFYFHSLYGMRFAYKKKIPCITLEHGTSHLSVHNKCWDKIGEVFEHCLTQIDKIYCKNYYGVSKACNEWLRHFGIDAKGVLYNSIDVDEISEIEKHIVPVYRKQYKIPSDGIVITFTGRLLKEKGLHSLLNVMEKVHQKNDKVFLFIAGDGDMEEEINTRKKEYIIPLGRLNFEEIVTLLNETDIFCLPSFSEGFSTSILEAAVCGCFIITTARGGAKELLLSEEYGCIIPNNKEEILFSALESVLSDEKRRKKGIELTFERIEKHFTWINVANQVERICEEMKN